jgi:hypothetical protein
MRFNIANIDIDGSIPAQTRLTGFIDQTFDLRAYEKSLRLWPETGTLSVIRRAINCIVAECSSRPVTFYGSGDLNFISALILEKLKQSDRPITLVLFDNHPDWFDLPPRYHCGNWVATALKLDLIESAVLVGQDSEDLKGHSFWFSPWPHLLTGRLKIFPYRLQEAFVPLRKIPVVPPVDDSRFRAEGRTTFRRRATGTTLGFTTVMGLGSGRLAELLGRELSGKNVYMAIDKDVLDSGDATSDWDHGRLRLKELTDLIEAIASRSNVLGADICGDRAPRALAGLVKRLDAGRLIQFSESDFHHATMLNEIANLEILRAIVEPRSVRAIREVQQCISSR